MKYIIKKEEMVFDDFFKIKKAKIVHDSFNKNQIEVDRLCFERGDSVAVLIKEKDTNCLLFTNQFRYPSIKDGNGWILELVAGSLNENEDPKNRLVTEIDEEIGYNLESIELISSFFVSPGGTSERILLYYGEVDSTDRGHSGGGLIDEKEDIELVKIDIEKCNTMLSNCQFKDAKTIIALQWYYLNKR